jgi:hypothetical protein
VSRGGAHTASCTRAKSHRPAVCSWPISTTWAGCISSKKKTSGKVSWRERKIAEVLESLKANDAIVVSELSLHNPRFERLLPPR